MRTSWRVRGTSRYDGADGGIVSYKNPLYVREGSKRFIKAAVFNDSLFLSNLSALLPCRG